MDKNQLLTLHDRHQRMEVEERCMSREATADVVRLVHRMGGEGSIIHSRLDSGDVERVIGEQIAHFQGIGQDFEWKTYEHDPPADLKTRLLAHGFTAEAPEALLVLEIDAAPAILLQPVTSSIQRIADPARLEEIARIQASVWGASDPAYIADLQDNLLHDPDHMGVFIAYAEGVPAAWARITYQDRSPFAGLWGGSTLKEYRGRGLYTSLLAVRLQEARRRGVCFLTIDASPMSRPIVEKLGFQFLVMTQPFKWHLPK
jgi:GNAT superfamily N-acetyltransferase